MAKKETLDHIFYHCDFAHWLLHKGKNTLGKAIESHNQCVNFDEITSNINSLIADTIEDMGTLFDLTCHGVMVYLE